MVSFPYFPFDGQTYHPKLGMTQLQLKDWIQIDRHAQSELQYRRELLSVKRDEVLQVRPGKDELCYEFYDLLKHHLLEYHPQIYRGEGGRFHVSTTGDSFSDPRSGHEALIQIGQWVQEDFCIVSDDIGKTLEAGLVCFPSRWSLKEKMGRGSDRIHADVPEFHDGLDRQTVSFLSHLKVEVPVERLNWTIHDSDHLYCSPLDPPREDLTTKNVLKESYLRIERQTLRRMPQSGSILFSIRTHQARLEEVLTSDSRRQLFKSTIEKMPNGTAEYKRLDILRPLLLGALG